MFSTIIVRENADIINLDQLHRNLSLRDYQFIKPKKGQLQSGLSTSSFIVKKNNTTIIVFVMKLSSDCLISQAYLNAKLINERQLKNQNEMVGFVDNCFVNNRRAEEDRLDFHMENIKNAAIRTEKKIKDYAAFSQEMVISDEYQQFLGYQKKVYEKILRQSKEILDKKTIITNKNKELINSAQKVEQSKLSLQSVILAYQDQKQYLSNTQRIFKELIEQKEKEVGNLSTYELNQTLFQGYLDSLINLETVKVKAKAAGV